MKNFKGGSKQFARYLDFEYNDHSLHPLKPTHFNVKQLLGSPVSTQNSQVTEEDSKPKESIPKKNVQRPRVKHRLTTEYLKQATHLLGPDAEKCYTGLCDFSYLTKQKPYLRYRQIYSKYMTVPVLFLSISYSEKNPKEIEAVYLWKVNRKAPYVTGEGNKNYTLTDTRRENADVSQYPSMMLLAKIIPEEGESILDARIAGESKLLVRSTTKDPSEIIFRLYCASVLYSPMRINPYKHEVLANEYYSFKAILKFTQDQGNTNMSIDLWKRSALEEMDLNTADCKEEESGMVYLYSDALISSKTYSLSDAQELDITNFFGSVNCSSDDWILFANKKTCTFLFWSGEEFQFIQSTEAREIQSIKKFYGRYYLLDQNGQFYGLKLDEASKWSFKKINHKLSKPLTPEFEFEVRKLYKEKAKHIIYFEQNKFYSVNLETSDLSVKILLDLERDGDLQVAWSIYSLNAITPNTVVIAFYLDGFVHFYDLATLRNNSVKVFRLESDRANKWKMASSGLGTLYLYDLEYKNMLVCIRHGTRLDALLEDDLSLDIEYVHLPKPNIQARKNKEFNLQIGALSNSIVLIPGENEPYYHDRINRVYPEKESWPICPINKTIEASHIEEEVKTEEHDAELIDKLWKIKRELTSSKNREFVLSESEKAMATIRENISGSMQKIWKETQYYSEENSKNRMYGYGYTGYSGKYTEKPEEAKNVAKECLVLYEEIKQEKKRMKREQEKRKGKDKKERQMTSFKF